MFALPNVDLQEPIEVDGFAIAPMHDERIKEIVRKQKRLASFLRKFRSEFGDPVQPSVIIWRSDRPDSWRTISAIAGFRDSVAMSVIPMAWSLSLKLRRGIGAKYADYFSVYPWMVDNKDENVITRTPSMWGLHEVKLLRPQSSAALSPHKLGTGEIDHPLLKELLSRWVRCFSEESPSPEDERLFRSLNMANVAAMMPAGADARQYDTLRSVALWASAFEILKPAKRGAFAKIYALLDAITWNLTVCKEKTYTCFGDQSVRNLPCWLFGEIVRLRNDTLHGNHITDASLRPHPAKQSLSMFASPLYRMVLASLLDLKPSETDPGTSDATEYMKYRNAVYRFGAYQRDVEAALASILTTDEEYEQSRRRVRRSMPP